MQPVLVPRGCLVIRCRVNTRSAIPHAVGPRPRELMGHMAHGSDVRAEVPTSHATSDVTARTVKRKARVLVRSRCREHESGEGRTLGSAEGLMSSYGFLPHPPVGVVPDALGSCSSLTALSSRRRARGALSWCSLFSLPRTNSRNSYLQSRLRNLERRGRASSAR